MFMLIKYIMSVIKYFLFFIVILISIANQAIPPKGIEEKIVIEFFLISVSQLPIVKVDIGEPKQLFNLVLDINAEQTWIASSLFNSSLSSSYNRLDYVQALDIDIHTHQGYLSTDYFVIDSLSIKAFDFLLVDTSSSIKGAVSFRREFDEKKNSSLVYRLFDMQQAIKPVFTLVFNDIHHGALVITNTNEGLIEEKKRMFNCTLANLNSRHQWGCNLTHVFIGDYGLNQKVDDNSKEPYYEIDDKKTRAIAINKDAIFETVYNKIYVDKEFMLYLKKNYFVIKESSCEFKETDKIIIVFCAKEDIVRLRQLNFIFDSHLDLYLSYKQLFDCPYAGRKCEFNIEYNEDITKLQSSFVIGLPLLKSFKTIFDQSQGIYFIGNNEEQIRFSRIANDQTSSLTKKAINYAKAIIYCFDGILMAVLIGICIIYALRYKNKRKRDQITKTYRNMNE